MNLITYDKAYSIFPRETFEDRRSLMFGSDNDEDSAVESRVKYEERGWTFVEGRQLQALQARVRYSPFAQGIRRLGDSKCWSISLHPEQRRSISLWESNSWKVVHSDNLGPINTWVLLDNPRILHFSYLVHHALAFGLSKKAMTLVNNE
jgi:hypothetical protein